MASSSILEQQLVIHSEELESYADKLKGNMMAASGCCKWSTKLQALHESNGADEEQLLDEIVDSQTR